MSVNLENDRAQRLGSFTVKRKERRNGAQMGRLSIGADVKISQHWLPFAHGQGQSLRHFRMEWTGMAAEAQAHLAAGIR